MSNLNRSAYCLWYAEIRVPGGAETVILDDTGDEIARYNADPDAYAAERHGLTKFEYLQWVGFDGAPLCGHRIKGGDLCRNFVGRIQMSGHEWKQLHRKAFCVAHGGEKKKR